MPLHYETYRQVVSALEKIVFFFTQNHTALDHLPDWVRDPEVTGVDFREVRQLLELAQAEIREADDALRERQPSWGPEEPFLDEDGILVTCALRFDGWRYKELTGFDQEKAFEDFFATGVWSISPLEQLAAFFLLQRGLFKWDLVYEPRTGKDWKAFRSLFLLVHSYEIPEALRGTGTDSYDRWEYTYKPRLSECVEFVRGIHSRTQYKD